MTSISSPPPPPTNEAENIATSAPTATLTTLHPDIIHSHILSRLDGAALAATAASSSSLRRLCSADHLWRQICAATWPSLSDPVASHVISTFSSGHRSIFSDAFPSLHHLPKANHNRPSSSSPPTPDHLISAVDIHYNGKPVFSRVQTTETQKNWFLSSSFWIDMLEPDEFIETPVKLTKANEEWFKHLEESLRLSWIVMDPTIKRAVNLSSRLPVSVGRHWLTRELEVVYSVAMMDEAVRCVVKVTCCGKVGGEVHVREVRLAMENAEGGHVRGKEGVEIVRRAMESGVRMVDADAAAAAAAAKERNERFEMMLRESREARHRRDSARDLLSTLIAFFAFLLLCWIAGLC